MTKGAFFIVAVVGLMVLSLAGMTAWMMVDVAKETVGKVVEIVGGWL